MVYLSLSLGSVRDKITGPILCHSRICSVFQISFVYLSYLPVLWNFLLVDRIKFPLPLLTQEKTTKFLETWTHVYGKIFNLLRSFPWSSPCPLFGRQRYHTLQFRRWPCSGTYLYLGRQRRRHFTSIDPHEVLKMSIGMTKDSYSKSPRFQRNEY